MIAKKQVKKINKNIEKQLKNAKKYVAKKKQPKKQHHPILLYSFGAVGVLLALTVILFFYSGPLLDYLDRKSRD